MSSFRTLDQADVKGRRVLVRVDLNVPMESGKITDATRIERVKPTIEEIADKGGKVILLSHFGRPKGRDPKASLRPVAAAVADVVGRPVAFADDCVGPKAEQAVAAMRPGDILCLENTRFHVEEEKNDRGLRRAARGARRHLRQRCVLGGAPRTRLDRGDCAQAPGLRGPQHAGRTGGAVPGPRTAGTTGGGDRRRRQDLHQARPARQPDHEGRCAAHRRRHGQHVPGRAAQGGRQVARRARPYGHGARHPGKGASARMRDRAAGRCGGGAEVRGRTRPRESSPSMPSSPTT